MSSSYGKDLAERVIATGLGGFVGGVGVDSFGVADLSTLDSAALAGVVAVLSLVKGIVATWAAERDSASLVSLRKGPRD